MPTWARVHTNPPTQFLPDGLMFGGAVLACEIHVPKVVAAALVQNGSPVPAPVTGWALIDTGATFTAVHEPTFAQLGVAPVGVALVGTASGPSQRPTYPARLVFPETGWDFDAPGPLTSVDLTGQMVNMGSGPQPILMLVGRDILRICVLVWNGPAAMWSLSF